MFSSGLHGVVKACDVIAAVRNVVKVPIQVGLSRTKITCIRESVPVRIRFIRTAPTHVAGVGYAVTIRVATIVKAATLVLAVWNSVTVPIVAVNRLHSGQDVFFGLATFGRGAKQEIDPFARAVTPIRNEETNQPCVKLIRIQLIPIRCDNLSRGL